MCNFLLHYALMIKSIMKHDKTIITVCRRSAVHELQERQGPDGDVRYAGAGQHLVQRVRPGRERVSASLGRHAEVIS